MKKCEISIIVPIYNADAYLEDCLNSIKIQSFSDFEVLMINDGSSDTSEDICKTFAEHDERFILINQANGGVCAARNKAIQNSSGEFIAFVDADDTIDEDFLELLHFTIKDNNADVVMCDFYGENGKEHNNLTYRLIEDRSIMFDTFYGGVYAIG